jgi:hypothetical protein
MDGPGPGYHQKYENNYPDISGIKPFLGVKSGNTIKHDT